MLPTILFVIAAIIALFVIIVALRPAGFAVSRKGVASAPAEVVFAQVNDLRKWAAWSPWDKIDPALQRTYAGSPAGTGAVYSWAGNRKVGEGSMTITESRPNEFIRFRLDFLKPFKSTNTAEFTFKVEGGQTQVTWSMSGECNFVTKAIGLFMNMDKMIGPQFEKGLADLKLVAEAAAKK